MSCTQLEFKLMSTKLFCNKIYIKYLDILLLLFYYFSKTRVRILILQAVLYTYYLSI